MNSGQSALIETQDLQQRLGDAALKIFDASYHIPPSPRQAKLEFEQQRIPGALFFDIDAIADPESSLPHMLPSASEFERHMETLGVQATDTVVVYDVHGIMSAPRAWWMFRYFGHEQVYVLNGGLPKWLAENRPVQSGPDTEPSQTSSPANARFKANPNSTLVCDRAAILASLKQSDSSAFQVVDMRSAGRFEAREAEPRAGLRSGHIPGSLNAPWGSWLQADKTLHSPAALIEQCAQLGLDLQAPVVTTCGSGITACVGALALYELGNRTVAVYDGAWAEWGANPELPVIPVTVPVH